jgi:glucose/arabinose dehydrogenase
VNKSLLLALAIAMGLNCPALAQVAPPPPTPEQLARAAQEDQLGDQKCGIPRNAADEYRPAPMYPDQTRAHRVVSTQKYKVDSIASGLQNAWGLAFLPSGNMLVTIRGSGLKTVTPDGKVSELLTGTPAIKTAIRLFGMHDVILDKDFAKNRTIYLAYVTQVEGGAPNTGYVASAKLAADEKAVTDYKILKQGAMTPRRLAQMKDGTLLVITSDVLTPYVSAQSLKSLQGKVLRVNADGSAPKDNPFASTVDADPSIYALGFRDAQGMAFHPQTGELWTIENEPRGGDELNVVRPGKNYGFPLISYGRDNDGKLLNDGKTAQDGLEQPVHFWTPSVAFSGMAFYTGDKLPGWKGNVFMGGLSGMQLVRLEMNRDGRVTGEEKLLRDRCKRIRDVRQGPDGLIYVLTDDANGEILRISPA